VRTFYLGLKGDRLGQSGTVYLGMTTGLYSVKVKFDWGLALLFPSGRAAVPSRQSSEGLVGLGQLIKIYRVGY